MSEYETKTNNNIQNILFSPFVLLVEIICLFCILPLYQYQKSANFGSFESLSFRVNSGKRTKII